MERRYDVWEFSTYASNGLFPVAGNTRVSSLVGALCRDCFHLDRRARTSLLTICLARPHAVARMTTPSACRVSPAETCTPLPSHAAKIDRLFKYTQQLASHLHDVDSYWCSGQDEACVSCQYLARYQMGQRDGHPSLNPSASSSVTLVLSFFPDMCHTKHTSQVKREGASITDNIYPDHGMTFWMHSTTLHSTRYSTLLCCQTTIRALRATALSVRQPFHPDP